MKNRMRDDNLKRILRDGIYEIPSDDFNERIIEKYMSEQASLVLKPGINYTILLVSVAMILFFSGLIFYVKAFSPKITFLVLDVEGIIEKMQIALLMITSFSIFNLINDIMEDKRLISYHLDKY
ncbi:hypothetical protein ACFL6H_01830 [Candidatus Latescibacterota bacterium]